MNRTDQLILLPEIARIDFSDKDLLHLMKLIYNPFTGLFYRKRYAMIMQFLKGTYGSILEVGFGPGIFVPTLSKKCASIYGVDIHRDIPKVTAVLKAHTNNFTPLTADLSQIPVKAGSFDVVICMSVLEHIKDLRPAFEEMHRIMHKDGMLLLGFPIKNKITKMLFSIIGYNDSLIHPSSHEEILRAAQERFTLREENTFPSWMGKYGLYYAGSFTKK